MEIGQHVADVAPRAAVSPERAEAPARFDMAEYEHVAADCS